MKTKIIAQTFALLILGVMTLTAKDTVKIGVILPLSGNNAHLGERLQKSVKLFEEDHPQYKGKYEFLLEDDQLTNGKTALAAQRLINIDRVKAIATFASGAGHVVAPLAKQKKILHFNSSPDPKVADGDFNFTHSTVAETQTDWLIKGLEAKKAKKVTVISMRTQASMIVSDLIEQKGTERGMTVETKYFNVGERDFRTPLTKLRFEKDKSDYIVIIFFSPELEIIIRQLREVGVDAPITTVNCFDFIQDRSIIEGRWYVSFATANEDWNTRFTKIYGAPPTFAEPYLYNILTLITDAYEHSPAASNEEASTWLKTIKDYPSIIGPLNMTDKGVVLSAPACYLIKDKKRTPISLEELEMK